MEKTNPKIWRKKPKQDRSEMTAGAILSAAESLFAAQGYHHATVEDIAQRAGVGVGSVYDYFPNKTAIALAILERTALAVAEDARDFLVENGSEPIEISLPKVIQGLYDGYKKHRRVLIDLVAEVSELRTARVYTLDRLIHRASLMYLQQYQDVFPDGDLKLTHAFLIHIFTSSVKHYLAAPEAPMPEAEFLDRLSEVLVSHLIRPAVLSQKPAPIH